MNQNLMKIGLGFGLGWFSKTAITEIKHQRQEQVNVPKIIKKTKKSYDAIVSHPERIPDALDKAHKELTSKRDDE